MNCSTQTPPPVDGLEDLKEFLPDHDHQGSMSGPIQTDIEDFTGPTPQPVTAKSTASDSRPATKAKPKSAPKPQRKAAANTETTRKPAQKAERAAPPMAQASEDSAVAGAGVNASNVQHDAAKPRAAESTLPDRPEHGAMPQAVSQLAQANPPRPLDHMLGTGSDAPLDALAAVLREVADAIARVTLAPKAMILSGVLATLSLAAQPHINVRLLHGSEKPTSLFFLTIGESGLRKTTVDDNASMGAKWAEAALLEDQKADAPDTWERIVRSGTYEGILGLLKDGAGSLALLNDDAGSFLGGHAMSAENRMKTTAGLSQLWDGSTVIHILADRDRSIRMSNRRFCVHLGIQPKLVLPLLADESFFNQGIIARFLMTAPESNIGYRPVTRPDAKDLQTINDFASNVRDLLKEKLPYQREGSHALNPRTLELSDRAYEVFVDYANTVEIAQRPFGPYRGLTGPASKFAENAIRIAGVLTYYENQQATMISEDQARRAVTIMRFYAAEMTRIVGAVKQSPVLASAQKVLNWLHDDWKPPTARFQDFYQVGPFRAAAENRPLVRVLERYGWLHRVSGTGYSGAADAWAIVRRPDVDAAVGGIPGEDHQ